MTINSGYAVTATDIAAMAAQAAFGRPLVTNVQRGLVVEAIVHSALRPVWNWCSGDYAAWDLERGDGMRLEIKQAASRQSWHKGNDPTSRISFDIRERKGRWEDKNWLAVNRRWADIYVFAHHDVTDETADHRNPLQWTFYVVAERDLPRQATLSLSKVKRLSQATSIECLEEVVTITLANTVNCIHSASF